MTTESKTSMQKIEIIRNPKQRNGLVVIVRHGGQQANIIFNTATSWGHLEQMIGCAAQGMKTNYDEMVKAFHDEYNTLRKANELFYSEGDRQDEQLNDLLRVRGTLTFEEMARLRNETS